MPNIWTHNLFGDQVSAQSKHYSGPDDMNQNNWFHLGCQGPDFLYYHRFFPWQNKSLLNQLGHKMHTEHCGKVLLAMAKKVREHTPEQRYQLGRYVLVFIGNKSLSGECSQPLLLNY